MTDFRMAEDPEENARFYASMSHDELIDNCIAAAKLVVAQIERAEHNRLRAEVATKHAKTVDARAIEDRETIVRIHNLLTTCKRLNGRENRKTRDEAISSVIKVLTEVIAAGWPEPLEMPPDIYAITIAPGEPREVPRGH